MCSNFTVIMYYIYSLSFNEVPFYIGMTNSPIERYRGHYYFNDCLTYNYVRYNLITHNKVATMKLICYCEAKQQALQIEEFCINMLTNAGFTLLNDRHHVNIGNRHRRKGLPPIYEHYSKLPYKWFTKELRASIFNQQLNVSKINYTHNGK